MKFWKPKLFLVPFLLGALQAHAELVLLVTHPILADWVEKIIGNPLEPLIPKASDSHTFEPTAKQTARLSQASLVIGIGPTYEPWLTRVQASFKKPVKELMLYKSVRKLIRTEHGSCKHFGHKHGNCNEDWDPHFWMDVTEAIHLVKIIEKELIAFFPQKANEFSQNAQSYIQELKALDAWAEETLSAIPPQKRLLVCSHNALGYFARRYQFTVPASLHASSTTDHQEPSAKQVARMLGLIKKYQVKALFIESKHNARILEQVAKAAGLPAPSWLYVENLSLPEGPAANYIEMMRYNVRAVRAALADNA